MVKVREPLLRLNGITESKLYYWLRKLGNPAPGKPESAAKHSSGFILLTDPTEIKSMSCITIRCRNGVEIEIPM
ncbi:IS66 family insertion sequence element accessory protein TnpA [Sinomicrobium oceani]|uniref:IS66 family insertion sequence element accessory protein TnpA n=1 Tax=Sinomicrobium oceani TaxID=1150368 RepID=UPI0038B4C607